MSWRLGMEVGIYKGLESEWGWGAAGKEKDRGLNLGWGGTGEIADWARNGS